MHLTLTAPPALEPMSLEEAKLHLRLDDVAEDDLIAHLITAARLHVERSHGLALIAQGWHDGQDSGVVSNGIFWDYDESSASDWRLCVADGAALAAVSSGRLVDTDYVWLGVFMNAGWTRADFFSSADGRSWTFHDSVTSGLPSAAALGFSAGIAKTSGDSERFLSIDLQAVRWDGNRGS
jgi:hypothetical protein